MQSSWWKEKKNRSLILMTGIFLLFFFVPFQTPRLQQAVGEAFMLLSYYAREHVLLCLVPAFFIAGAIMVFLNQQSVIKYLGPHANKAAAYGVASVSGSVLAVCSCTVLPIFKGIYQKGAGIGPAISFLYSGPAINILAIILTANVLGLQLGIARAVGAVLFAVVIGLLMRMIFRKEDNKRAANASMFQPAEGEQDHSLGTMAVYMASMIGILVFLNWAPPEGDAYLWDALYRWRFLFAGGFALFLSWILYRRFTAAEMKTWVGATRDFAVQILPLLFAGVMIAGFLLGRPGEPGLIPEEWVASLVGGNSLEANFFASIAGALMYFATLTEVPIMQGLIGAGMGQGPSLALLLAGPSLSLPSILVIHGELGWKKTVTYIGLVVIMSTFAGFGYGYLF